MSKKLLKAAALIGVALIVVPAAAQREDQTHAYEARQRGQALPLHRIEMMVVPRIEATGAVYLRSSPEFDPERGVYRLKFQRSYKVFWVDVDARTGREIGRSGR